MPASFRFQSMLHSLKLRHLVLLDSLAQTGNAHLTADQMHLSQPAVSKMLRDLEALFGFALFERLPRSMRPTELGEVVILYARRTLNDAGRFYQELDSKRKGGYGNLLVGTIVAAAPGLLSAAIARIKERRPLLTIQVFEQTSDQLLVSLEQKRFDLGIGRLTGAHQKQLFNFRRLAGEPLWLVVQPNHELAQKKDLFLAELIDRSWILHPMSSPMRQLLEETLAEKGLKTPTNIVETTSLQTTLRLVQTSDMIAMLPASVVQEYVQRKSLARLQIAFEKRLTHYGIITRKDDFLSEAAREFIDLLAQD